MMKCGAVPQTGSRGRKKTCLCETWGNLEKHKHALWLSQWSRATAMSQL